MYKDVLTDHEKSIGCIATDVIPSYIRGWFDGNGDQIDVVCDIKEYEKHTEYWDYSI